MRVQSIDKLDCKVSENAVASASQGYAPPAAALRPPAPMWPTVGGPCATVFGIAANALMPQGLPKAVPKSRPSDRFLCVDRASIWIWSARQEFPPPPTPNSFTPHPSSHLRSCTRPLHLRAPPRCPSPTDLPLSHQFPPPASHALAPTLIHITLPLLPPTPDLSTARSPPLSTPPPRAPPPPKSHFSFPTPPS